MDVIEIRHEEATSEYAGKWNDILGGRPNFIPLKKGDIILRDLEIGGVMYKGLGKFIGVDYRNKEAVLAIFEAEKEGFKGEYHWVFTKDQRGIYAFYRSAKMLKTLKKEYPERFA